MWSELTSAALPVDSFNSSTSALSAVSLLFLQAHGALEASSGSA
jgi:hypothetical protein